MAVGDSFGFWLRPKDIEPTDDVAWSFVDEATRRWFWRQAVLVAGKTLDDSRERGLDRFDQPLKPITEKTRRNRKSAMGTADPDAPPLIPAWALSRTRSLIRTKPVEGQGAWFYYLHGPGKKPWGQILRWHAEGAVAGGKIRDVLGFSPQNLEEIRREMRIWWNARRGYAAQQSGQIPINRPTRPEIEVVIPGPVLPRSQRAKQFGFEWQSQRVETRVAQRSVDSLINAGGLGPGTVGQIFRPPPTRPTRLRFPQLVGGPAE
jgi:hypothetical protein